MDFYTKLLSSEATVSYEFFPPRHPEAVATLEAALSDALSIGLDFVSVTYGAGGSTRSLTSELVKRVQRELNISAMAHLTCVGHSRDELRTLLSDFDSAGISAIMALRGDPPKGSATFQPHPEGFEHADQLIDFIAQEYPRFKIGCATYPEGHPESESLQKEAQILKLKERRGAHFAITQLFFDNRDFFEFREFLCKAGVTVPVVPGVVSIASAAQIKKFTTLCGATIPPALMASLDKYADDDAACAEFGIEYATRQCRELLRAGAPGIHFYTLNKARSTCA